MSVGDAIRPVQETTLEELSSAFLNAISVVTFGTPGAEAAEAIAVRLQLTDMLGTDLPKAERIRITASGAASMTLVAAGDGTVLTGDNSDDIIVLTDAATGAFDLEVTKVGAATVTLVVGMTQGSGLVVCNNTIDLTFAA